MEPTEPKIPSKEILNGHLKKALDNIQGEHLLNACYHLDEVEFVDLRDKLLLALLLQSLPRIKENLNKLKEPEEDNEQEEGYNKLSTFTSFLLHTPKQIAITAKAHGLKNSFYVALNNLIALADEVWGNREEAIEEYTYLEDKDGAERASRIPEDVRLMRLGRKENSPSLVKRLLRGGEQFLSQVSDLEDLDARQMVDEVKEDITTKLTK